MESWVVTGAQGLLGANAGVFLSGKANTIGLVRRAGRVGGAFERQVEIDLMDVEGACQLLERIRPSVILHCAAVASHEQCDRSPAVARHVNVEATRAIASVAEEVGSRFIYISTDAVFDGSQGVYREIDDPHPFSLYGQTKLDGERAALEVTDALVVRTNFFGWSPTGRGSILEFFLNALSAKEPTKGFTDYYVTTMYVQHLLEAVWTLSRREVTGIVHVASRDSLSKYEYAVELAEVFGLDPGLIEPSSEEAELLPQAKRRDISLDTGRFREITGQALPSQREGLVAARADIDTVRRLVGRNIGPWADQLADQYTRKQNPVGK